jgi:rhodanese-related sulfurtransferase
MKAFLVLSLLLLSSTAFTHDKKPAGVSADKLKLITVKDLVNLQASKDKVYIFDANNADTRLKNGIIPGAKTLSQVSDYKASDVLPADHNANLVFYCANEMCQASHDAAKVAIKAHYKNVSVMADGIEGWKKAGKPIEKAPASS